MFSFHTYLKQLLTLILRLVWLELDNVNTVSTGQPLCGQFYSLHQADTISSEFSSANSTLSITEIPADQNEAAV